jgi:non-specific serine/threonine protein kinase
MSQNPIPDLKQPGALIGSRYRLVERLGQGGMAEVYKAYQESLDRYLAIKFMHAFLAEDPQFQQRFQREARSVAALHHPNIVQVIDFDWAEGAAYMVMEFIDGPTLEARLAELAERGERLPLADSVRITRDAALALSYAHARDIVHRDIKSANIMLERSGRVVLTDFGLAKLLSATRFTASGAIMGTPAYMAPEQALGQTGDKRVDIYALGVLLYELVTGRLPFEADSAIALVLMHLNQAAARPRSLNPDLPEGLEQVILKAMAKQPEARFQTADEFAAHLNYFLSPASTVLISPAEPSVSLRPLPPHNLPAQPTSFVGRQQELAEACARLRQPDARLITLTGPGGAGKTRLSLQIASTLLPEFADGVFFVPLADVREPDLVISAIAQDLGVKESADRSLLDHVKAHLGPRQTLLVLDNFEQALAAAPLIAELMIAAPGLKVLVTSRAALRVYGEYEFPVPPLAVPDLDQLTLQHAADLTRYTAISLFAERAQAVKPTFNLNQDNALTVAQICARLDGLPLAIELVAPRIKLLSLSAILSGLDNRFKLLTGGARDLPARQRTLRGAIDWGYNLLEEAERVLFARLAVFAGGFTLASAEAVIGDTGEGSVLDGLTVLVDNSLLRQTESAEDEPRFAMLETIREYALEKLREAAGGELARDLELHSAHYLALAESAAPQLQGRDQIAALNRLEAEHANLISALDGALSRRSLPTALRLGSALWRFWLLRGYLSEGLKWLEEVRALAKDASPDPNLLASALYGAAALRHERGDSAAASALFGESLALFKQAGAARETAHAQNDLGASLLAQRRYDQAAALCEASLADFRQMNDEWGVASALTHLGLAALSRGDAPRATQLFQESLVLFQKLGDRWGMALALNNLGLAALPQGDDERASTLVQSSLALVRELGGR